MDFYTAVFITIKTKALLYMNKLWYMQKNRILFNAKRKQATKPSKDIEESFNVYY